MVTVNWEKALTVARRDGELVLCINGSCRELLFFAIDRLPERTTQALSREDMATVKRHLISYGWDFLNNDFVLGRLLTEARTEA
jgi:hypothetical protein